MRLNLKRGRASLHYTSTTRMPTEDGYDRTWLQDISYDGLKKLARVHGIEDDAEVAEYATSFLGDVAAGFAAEFCARRAALVR